MLKRYRWLIGLVCACAAGTAQAQTRSAPSGVSTEEGIPVQSEVVRSQCGACHAIDDQMRMSRISYRRTSPENWERTIKRMVSLNDAQLDPADARAILKYLADHNGLAPEEVRPIAFEAERRLVEYTYSADKETSDLCSSCHSIARVLSERRTKEEWELLVAMHRGYYPLVDNQPMNGGQGFRGTRPPEGSEAGSTPPENRYPMDRVIAHLSKTFPLMTPEWTRWAAAMQPAQLAGRWAISGDQLGKGPIFGQVIIAPDPAGGPDYFTTETRYTVARTGETVTRQGRAIVYAGFQWRGRGATPGSQGPWSEVMFVERDRREMSGRWYTGAYDETGIDVHLVRLGGGPAVFGSSVTALKTPSSGQAVTLYGAELPTSLSPQDISFGQGVTVTRVVSARADEVALQVDVSPNAPLGPRDVSVSGAVKPAALIVYDTIDGIKVVPEAGMARVGGIVFPKGFQQFQAIGVNNGPDGKPGTPDDLDLGIVDVRWSLEEYTATFGDDDINFVGSVDDGGLFTPNVDGPNPARSGNRDNVGDVWVVAELPTTGAGATPLRARAHLLVTVPIYMAWFESEGGR